MLQIIGLIIGVYTFNSSLTKFFRLGQEYPKNTVVSFIRLFLLLGMIGILILTLSILFANTAPASY